MSEEFDELSENEENEEEGDDSGNVLDGALALARFLGISNISFTDDDDEDGDGDEDDEGAEPVSFAFGLGDNGEITPFESEGEGGFSFSVTMDEDGEEIPEIRCPKCSKKDCGVVDSETDTYKCNSCGHEFIPNIYKVLNTAEEYADRAWRNCKERNFKRAIKDCNQAIKLDPNFAFAYTVRGKVHQDRDEYEEAEKDFTEAIRISPEEDAAIFSRGMAREKLENFDGALEDFSKSINLDPDFAETYKHRAFALFQLGRYQDAVNDFSEALKRDPDNASTVFQRGFTYSQLGDDEKAIQDYTEAIQMDPDYQDAYARRAEVYEKLGRDQEALSDYQALLRKLPENAIAPVDIEEKIKYLQLKLEQTGEQGEELSQDKTSGDNVTIAESLADSGTEKLNNGDYEGCVQDLTEAIRLEPSEENNFTIRGLAYFKLNLELEALADLTEAIRLGTNTVQVFEARGIINWNGNLFDLAITDFEKAISLGSKDPVIYTICGMLYTEKKSFDKAISVCSKAIDLDPNNTNAFFTRGCTFAQVEDYRSAISDGEVCLQRSDDKTMRENATGLINFCREQQRSEKPQTKKKVSQSENLSARSKIMNDPAQNYDSLIEDGKNFVNNGQIKKAQRVFTKAISMDRYNSTAYVLAGNCAIGDGDMPGALEYLKQAIAVEMFPKRICILRACLLRLDGREEANEDFMMAVCADLDYSFHVNVLSKLPLENNQMIIASEHFAASITLDVTTTAAALVQGSLNLIIGKSYSGDRVEQFYKPIDLFNAAIEQENENAVYYWCRSLTYSSCKKKLLDYLQAVKLMGDNARAYYILGYCRLLESDVKGAIQDFNRSLKIEPEFIKPVEKLGLYYHFKMKNSDQAIAVFSSGIKRNPSSPNLYYLRGLVYEQKGEYKSAISDYQKFIDLDGYCPSSPYKRVEEVAEQIKEIKAKHKL